MVTHIADDSMGKIKLTSINDHIVIHLFFNNKIISL